MTIIEKVNDVKKIMREIDSLENEIEIINEEKKGFMKRLASKKALLTILRETETED